MSGETNVKQQCFWTVNVKVLTRYKFNIVSHRQCQTAPLFAYMKILWIITWKQIPVMLYSLISTLFSILIKISSIITLCSAIPSRLFGLPPKLSSSFFLPDLYFPFLPCLPEETRWPVHHHPAGRAAARHCGRYDLPVWPGLHPQRPGCPQHPSQQQPGV